jgi:hypothetical protein
MGADERDRGTGRLAVAPAPGERRPEFRHGGLRAVGGAASRIAGPIVARHGGGVLGRLKAQWGAAAGAELAGKTWPEALGRDGALKLRVVPGFAVELQHRAPSVIERINGFFGRDAVARLVLRQGPLPLTVAATPGPAAPPLSASQARELDARLADIADPELRAALGGLGHLVLAKANRSD